MMTHFFRPFFRVVAGALVAAVALATIDPAGAAPIWIERRFVPEATLIDPAVTRHAEAPGAVVDHAALTTFLDRYRRVDANGVARIAYGSVTPPDRAALAAYLGALGAVRAETLARDEALAFWINLYNAATLELILGAYPVASIQDISRDGKGPWDIPFVDVLIDGTERRLTLNDIEHGIIRAAFAEPRIHYAVNCASVGCPDLAASAYEGARLDAMLEAAAIAYVNHPRGVSVVGGKVRVSKIFGWYRDDFGRNDREVLDHLRRFADPGLAQALEGLRQIAEYDYDWSLNDAGDPPAAAH